MSADPAQIDTVVDLADSVDAPGVERSGAGRRRAAQAPPALSRRTPVAPPRVVRAARPVRSVPSRETLVTFLATCGVTGDELPLWLAAWEQTFTEHAEQPPGGVRVRDARPRALGVHAAITVADAVGELPTYVPRDLDDALRAQLSVAAGHGSFVLLVGASSTGKTRTLWEAIRAVLPGWWLVYPDGLEHLIELADTSPTRTVVWLDELQTYFDRGPGLVGAVRRLLHGGSVLAGTLWSHEYSTRVAQPLLEHPDQYEHDRKVLGLAEVFDVPATFTDAERIRAEALALTDARLRIALDTPDYGPTQVLAAGPELVRWWEHASDPYGKAIITAALDARRVGSRHPATRELLVAAAAGYLTPAQRAAAHPDWTEHALAYATTSLRGAAAALVPVGHAPGQQLGYLVADYLYQHARRLRRCVPLPDAAWDALVQHGHPDDLEHLGYNAELRMRDTHAMALYRRADKGGKRFAAYRLIEDMVLRGNTDDVRTRADHGDQYAADRLATELAVHGDDRELRGRAERGDPYAANRLAWLLARQGNIEELRARARAGDESAVNHLVDVLVERGRTAEATNLLRTRADAGNWLAVQRLTFILARQGRIGELQARADAGEHTALNQLIDVLVERGRDDEAVAVLRTHAAHGNPLARQRLVELLASRGNTVELQVFAAQGDDTARHAILDMLAAQHRVAELRAHAATGDRYAAEHLIDLLAAQHRIDELRAHALAGDDHARLRLADLLAENGDMDELSALARTGCPVFNQQLVNVLTKHGRIDELRNRADTGDPIAAKELVDLLAKRGQLEQLRQEAHAGTPGAAERLTHLTNCPHQATSGPTNLQRRPRHTPVQASRVRPAHQLPHGARQDRTSVATTTVPVPARGAPATHTPPLLVLTAIELEYWAMRQQLSDLTPYQHPGGTIFEVGTLPGSPWQVTIAVTGPGNVDAGVLTERAIALFGPAAVLFVGVAGALKDWIALGDVVVGTRVFAYHGGREDRSGFHARPRSWDAAHGLEQTARHVARADVWHTDDPPPPTVHFLPIAAGEVVLNAPSSPLAVQLRGQYDDAAAIEMESAGACAAAHLNGGLPMLTIRGISDSIRSVKEHDDREGWPATAAHRAALFAAHLIRHLDPHDLRATFPAARHTHQNP